jgi:fructokinase
MGAVVEFLHEAESQIAPLAGIGIAMFGPIEIRPSDAHCGRVGRTPKLEWRGTNVLDPLRAGFGVPLRLDTDVNGAALAESKHGAGADVGSIVYITIGTGIGGATVVDGAVPPALVHPEMGHITVRRPADDDFAGVCPLHGDCWEGLASGTALEARNGRAGAAMTDGELAAAVVHEARDLAAGICELALAVAPHRFVLGGGVAVMPGLIDAVRSHVGSTLGSYPGVDDHRSPRYVVTSGLGGRAGLVGSMMLGHAAASAS